MVFPSSALYDGLWEVEDVRPLPSTVRSASMAETFSMRSPTAPTGTAVGDDLDDNRIAFNRLLPDGTYTGWVDKSIAWRGE